MTTKRQNITIDTEVHKRFMEIANEKGIKLSPWVNAKMKKFIEEESFDTTLDTKSPRNENNE